jgi:hypothetical protein
MTSVGIADLQAALEKVRQFIELLESSRAVYRNNPRGSDQGRQANSRVHESLPLILQIADRADPDLVPNVVRLRFPT